MIRIAIDEKLWIKRVFWTCVGIELTIVLMDIFLNYYQWIPFRLLRRSFNITREDAIGNWFASLQTLVIALVILLICLSTSPRKKGWAFLSVFFGYLAFDDATRFHERVGSGFGDWMGAGNLKNLYPSYSWQVVFLPIFGLAGMYILVFLWREFRNSNRMWFVMCAFMLLGLAVSLDFLEGIKLTLWNTYTPRHFQKLIEETIEMFAMTLFLVTFLGHLIEGKKAIEIT